MKNPQSTTKTHLQTIKETGLWTTNSRNRTLNIISKRNKHLRQTLALTETNLGHNSNKTLINLEVISQTNKYVKQIKRIKNKTNSKTRKIAKINQQISSSSHLSKLLLRDCHLTRLSYVSKRPLRQKIF